MNLDERLGLTKQDQEEDTNNYVFSREIDAHFKAKGFYEHTMNPRFMDAYCYDQLTIGEPVLRLDFDDPQDDQNYIYVTRIFINKNEVYMEKQTSYRSCDSSDYYRFAEEPTTIAEIEQAILEVLE